MVNTVSDVVLFAGCGILQEAIVKCGGETDTQDGKVNVVLGFGPVNGSVPHRNVDTEGGRGVGVAPVSDNALLTFHNHIPGGSGKRTAVVDVVAEGLNSDGVVINAGRGVAKGHTGVYGAVVEAVALSVDGGRCGDRRSHRQVLVQIHTGGDFADEVIGGGNVTLDGERVADAQRGRGAYVFDGNVTGEVIDQGAIRSLDIQGCVIEQYFVIIGTGSVLMQSLDGQHGVGRKGVFGTACIIGLGLHCGGHFCLNAEAGGVTGGDIV